MGELIIKIVLSVLGGGALLWVVFFVIFGLTFIGSTEIGVVQKLFGGGSLQDGHFIALKGESGFQPDVLRAGLYFRTRFMYKVHRCPLVTIPQGQLGYAFARDGKALEDGQILATDISKKCATFQNARAFLENGGQKGPQRAILREGTYAFNLGAFIILTEAQNYYINIGSKLESQQIQDMSKDLMHVNGFRPIVIKEKMQVGDRTIKDPMAIVTVQDGPAVDPNEIIAPVVGIDTTDVSTYHNNFQNPEAYLRAGGRKGKQEQTLSDGTYYINRKFATVEYCEKTQIEIGYVGVVVSYTGKEGEDISGDAYSHGQLVTKGCKGVWAEPMKAGKYAFNTSAGKISQVPTTNFTLKWIEAESNDKHDYDENLKEVTIITNDAFEPTLPLSVVIHINDKDAPYIIQTFESVKNLVEQTLDPMISAYFKNVVQKLTLIELIQKRSEIQADATQEMKKRFRNYNLELEEVLIGTPNSNGDKKIELILSQLSERQLAKEQITTYESKMKASEKERELKEFQAKAEQQEALTKSSINIQVQDNIGKAELERAKQDAEKQKTLADAKAYQTVKLGQADAEMRARIGIAEGIAISEKVKAYGGAQMQVVQDVMTKFTEAIKEGNIPIVPRNIVTMGGTSGEGGQGNALESLLGILMSKELGVDFKETEENEYVKKMKEDILNKMTEEKKSEVKKEVIVEKEVEKTPEKAIEVEYQEKSNNNNKNKNKNDGMKNVPKDLKNMRFFGDDNR